MALPAACAAPIATSMVASSAPALQFLFAAAAEAVSLDAALGAGAGDSETSIQFELAMVEIYNEQVYDLMHDFTEDVDTAPDPAVVPPTQPPPPPPQQGVGLSPSGSARSLTGGMYTGKPEPLQLPFDASSKPATPAQPRGVVHRLQLRQGRDGEVSPRHGCFLLSPSCFLLPAFSFLFSALCSMFSAQPATHSPARPPAARHRRCARTRQRCGCTACRRRTRG
jgi:hypothetical protein